MHLFNLDQSHENIMLRCGIDAETLKGLLFHLQQEFEKGIIDTYSVDKEELLGGLVEGFGIVIPVSHAEMAQSAAEYLDRELTPEIGLVVGLVIGDLRDMSRSIITNLIKEGRIKIPGIDLNGD